MRPLAVIAALASCLLAVPVGASDETLLVVPFASADTSGPLPADVVEPEGRTPWDLRGVKLAPGWVRTVRPVEATPGGLSVSDGPDHVVLSDPAGQGDAERWLLPHRDEATLAGSKPLTLFLEERRDGTVQRLRIVVRRVGSGRLYLPSGSREVVLQRALILRQRGESDEFVADALVHRWVDPRFGTVAEVSGPVGADGRTRARIERIGVLQPRTAEERASTRGTGLRLYSDEQKATPFGRVNYGLDAGAVTIDEVAGAAPGSGTTIWDFACNPATPGGTDCQSGSWDFSGINFTTYPNATIGVSTTVPVAARETCSSGECGFVDATQIGREDKDFERLLRLCQDGATDCLTDADCTGIGPDQICVRGELCDDDTTRCIADSACTGIGGGSCSFGAVTVNGLEWVVVPATKETSYLRAVVRNEGETQGGLGENESRVCYSGGGRSDVPLFEFDNVDGSRFYMDIDDTWTSNTFACELNIFNAVCPDPNPLQLYVHSCSGGYSGTQNGEVINEGTVTLPSGHTFDTLVVRQVAEFCVNLFPGCGGLTVVQRVRQAIYLWEVPRLGTVARLMSEQNVGNVRTFTTLTETDVKYGLFPPVSISTGTVTDGSIEVLWNPGAIDDHITEYVVYWDVDSGSATPYANSVVVPATQSSTVLTGLDPDTDYFITVTARSDYRFPANSPQTTYESFRFPTQTGGVPIEVTERTDACVPSVEVTGITVGKVGSQCQFCWDPVVDPCIDGYRLLGSSSPTGPFSVIAETATTCAPPGNPTETYFRVVGKGPGGEGPTGQ